MYRIIGTLGFLLMISPFLLGYSSDHIAVGASIVLGSLVVLSSYIEGIVKDKGRWEYKVAVVAGFATILAPFLFLYENFSRSILLSLSIGILLITLGGVKLYIDSREYKTRKL